MLVARLLPPVAVIVLFLGCGRGEKEERAAARQLRTVLSAEAPTSLARSKDGKTHWEELRRLYSERGHRPGWTRRARPTPAWDLFLAAAAQAESYGLDPALYDVADLKRRREEAEPRGLLDEPALEPSEIADAELRLSHAFMRYASHLRGGLTEPRDIDPRWPRKASPRVDLVALVSRTFALGRPDQVLGELLPPHAGFRQLLDASHRYRALVHFRGDVYGHDSLHIAALERRRSGR